MTSVCISNCVNDARDPRVPVRATYVNLYKWPESDAEFVRAVTSSSNVRQGVHVHGHGHPRVVDSISCRQMYLRSYKFSRDDVDKEAESEKTAMCFGRVKEKDKEKDNNNNRRTRKRKEKERRRKRNKCLKNLSCNALFRLFHRLLSCGSSIDVADR
ncbi:uncharacterized protein LOC123202397 [Mangifera indica]|uniref:uncharacterized protein LOC123202397 n=1 Tax=Mangifera indica TaxID=29780 RepID=UPI001CFA682A|nr:uncharacterized protein LOC123202397 [Mangifera indica]